MDLHDPIFLMQGGFERLKEVRVLLRRDGIDSEIVKPPGANTNR